MYGTLPLASAGFGTFAGFSYATAVTQSAGAAGALVTRGVLNAVAADGASASLSGATQAVQQLFVVDAARAAHTPTASVFFPAATQDAASARAAAPLASIQLLASVVTSASGAGAFSARAAFAAVVADRTHARVFNFGLRRWELVDDTQQSNWTDVLIARTIDTGATLGGDNYGVTTYAGNSQFALPVNDAKWVLTSAQANGQWGDVLVATFVDDVGAYAGAAFGAVSYAGQYQAFIPESIINWSVEDADTPAQWQDVL